MSTLGKILSIEDPTKPPVEYAIEIGTIPRPEWGAPLPQVIANEGRVLLIYALNRPLPENQTGPFVFTEDTPSPWAVVDFSWIFDHRFGGFSDILRDRHPLADSGLSMGGVHIVVNSVWKAKILSELHPNPITLGRPRPELVHYIFTFHDSMFECIAGAPTTLVLPGTAREVVQKVCTEMLFVDR